MKQIVGVAQRNATPSCGDEMKLRWSFLAVIALGMTNGTKLEAVTVNAQPWGNVAGHAVELYTLKDSDVEVQLTNYGARIVSIRVGNRAGQMSSVVLGSYLEQRNSVFLCNAKLLRSGEQASNK